MRLNDKKHKWHFNNIIFNFCVKCGVWCDKEDCIIPNAIFEKQYTHIFKHDVCIKCNRYQSAVRRFYVEKHGTATTRLSLEEIADKKYKVFVTPCMISDDEHMIKEII